MSTLATKEAMNIVHDFFDAAKLKLSNVTDLLLGLAWDSITTKFIEASKLRRWLPSRCWRGSSILGWGSIQLCQRWGWRCDWGLCSDCQRQYHRAAASTTKYIYGNDADADQQLFQGYPAKSLHRLKEIRAKYDPGMVYTNLMPGGFKVEHAWAGAKWPLIGRKLLWLSCLSVTYHKGSFPKCLDASCHSAQGSPYFFNWHLVLQIVYTSHLQRAFPSLHPTSQVIVLWFSERVSIKSTLYCCDWCFCGVTITPVFLLASFALAFIHVLIKNWRYQRNGFMAFCWQL